MGVRRVRRAVYCTALFSVCSRRRTELPIIYADFRLDYKLATLPFIGVHYFARRHLVFWQGKRARAQRLEHSFNEGAGVQMHRNTSSSRVGIRSFQKRQTMIDLASIRLMLHRIAPA